MNRKKKGDYNNLDRMGAIRSTRDSQIYIPTSGTSLARLLVSQVATVSQPILKKK